MDNETQIGRRKFATGLLAAPLALMASDALAQIPIVRDPVGAFDLPRSLPARPTSPRVRSFDLSAVQLAEGPYRAAQQANIAYMKRLDPDRLLHTFRLNAGIASSAQPLGGWEAPTSELRGHFIGHYLSGCAIAYRSTGDEALRRRGVQMVAVLAECQKRLGERLQYARNDLVSGHRRQSSAHPLTCTRRYRLVGPTVGSAETPTPPSYRVPGGEAIR